MLTSTSSHRLVKCQSKCASELVLVKEIVADNPGAVTTVGLGAYAHWTWRQFLDWISRSRLPISAGMATIAAMYAIYTQRSEIAVLARQRRRRRHSV